MPSINRIRLVNIQYDKGGKQYADELFKLHGKNTLFNLANGGGKTLWLQLVTQAALPGAMYGSRRMVDLLAHERYTGHILVEWKLDNFAEREFLLTGFCFTKSADEEGELKYFTYTHQYKIADEFGIVKMPLVNEGRVLSYGDFYNLLRKEGSAGGRKLQTFSQHDRRKYINHLAPYNIYEKEWLAIRTTNGSEGGMDGFFARSKTEQSLLENLLIPTVDQALFQDDDEAQDLANSFMRYKDKLLRIPQIEKNLEEFRVIEEAGRTVLEKVERYSESGALKRELEGQLTSLKGRLEEMVVERTEEAEALELIVGGLKEQIREEEFKQASLDVNALQEQFRKAEVAVQAFSQRLSELEEAETEAEQQVRLHRAVPKFLQIKEFEKRLARDQETLAGLDMQNEDLLTELSTYRGQFLTLWQERVETLQAELAAKQADSHKWKEVERAADQRLVELADALNDLSKTSGEIAVWFKQFEQQKRAVITSLGEEIAEEPVLHRDDLRWKEIEWTNAVRELEAKIEQNEAQIEKGQADIETAKDEQRTAKRDQERTESKIAEYEARKMQVQGRLELLDLSRTDLHGSKADLELALTQKREGYAREYAKLAAKKGAVEEKVELLKSDHYIPSQDLLYFQQVLGDWGIEAVLGSQWLQEQEEALRESYVRANPLLPYALLLGDGEIKKLHDPRLDWEGVRVESLVPLFAMSSLTAVETAGDSQVMPLGAGGFVSLHGGYSPFLSQDSLNKRRAGLQDEELDLIAKMEVVEKSRRHIEQVIDELSRYFDTYGKDPLHTLQTKRDAWLLKCAEKGEEIERLSASIAELRSQVAEAKQDIKRHAEQVEGLREQLRLLDPFAGLAAERKEREAQRSGQKEQEAALKAEQRDVVKSRQEAREQEERLMPALFQLENETTALQKEREKYVGTSDLEALPAEAGLTYDQVQGKLDSLEDLLAQKSVGRDELVRLIQNHEESIKQNLDYIAEQKVTDAELAAFQSAPPASELTYWESRLKATQSEQKLVEKDRSAVQAEQKKLEGMIETEEKKVQKEYERKPYRYGDDVDLGAEKERLKLLLSDLWMQRKSNESAREETKTSLDVVKSLLQKAETLLSAYSIECEPLELPEERANKLIHEPTAVVAEIDKALQKTTKQTEERRRELDDEFYRFERSIDKYESKIVQKFIRSVIDSKSEGDMNDIEQVRPVFEKCFEMMNLYIEKAHLERQELEEAKEELVHRCLQHADRVYDNLKSIAQYTKIDYRGKKVQAIDIQLKEKWEEPEGLRVMSSYLHALTEELQAKVAKGEDEDDIEKWLLIKLSSKHLLNVTAPIGEARIKVFKPQQVPGEKVRYDHWSEIMKWSGGEQYTGCFAMFIAVLSYLRAKMSGIENASKVLLADNPFGVVSSPHLLQVIFKLAQANRVQMICLSDHNKQSIYDLFEVVYSLKLVPALGRSIIQSTERRPESVMEAGFYEIDFDQEVETEQKSLPI
ncbi:hypothetical protein CIG75_04230 [Tumebacillus algifaecis]|uniref:Chromosome segregation ATPase n=1 Tax=Tumebacillus algifaecis TaxID=1214604 RepID=A0A223CXZ9_9BACL|nr:hypothetical protein [Tumebacillus algifaecis]ASS74270.1 hypothetical protein CIG75_04230 [Tumebacillus algifaecis]